MVLGALHHEIMQVVQRHEYHVQQVDDAPQHQMDEVVQRIHLHQ